MEWMDLLTNFANLFAFSSSIEGLSKFCNYGNSLWWICRLHKLISANNSPFSQKLFELAKLVRCGLTAISTRNPTGNQPALGSHKGFQVILGWTMKKNCTIFLLFFSAFPIMKCPQLHIRESLHIEKKSTFHCTLGVVVVEMEGINSCPDFSNWLENVNCMKFSNFNQCVALCCVWKSSNWQKGWKSIVCSVDPIDLSGNVHPWKAQKDFSIGGIPSLSPGWLDVWNLKLN